MDSLTHLVLGAAIGELVLGKKIGNRALIWGATNDLKKATNIASTVGQVFGWIMIAAGVFIALSGNLISGIEDSEAGYLHQRGFIDSIF